MKNFCLTLLAIVLTNGAHAQSNVLRDIWYADPAGKFAGESGADLAYSRTKIDGAAEQKNRDVTLSQRIRYGLTSNLNIYGQGDYEFAHQKGGESENGFSTFTLGTTFRKLLSEPSHLFIRGTAELSPFLGKKTEHSELAGNTSFVAQVDIGQALGRWEYTVAVGLEYFTKTYQSSGNVNSSINPNISVLGQYDVSPFWSIDALAKLAFPGDQKDSSTGRATTFNLYHSFQVGPDWQFTRDLRVQLLAGAESLRGHAETGPKFTKESITGSAAVTYNFN